MSELKSKKALKMGERQKLVDSISRMKVLGYSDQEIADVMKDHKQVVSAIYRKQQQYPISFKKAKGLNDLLESFITKVS